jgi:hypothetical protein
MPARPAAARDGAAQHTGNLEPGVNAPYVRPVTPGAHIFEPPQADTCAPAAECRQSLTVIPLCSLA